VCLPFLLFGLLAAASPSGKLFHIDKSPSGAILAEHFIFEARDPRSDAPLRQIWLRDTQGKDAPTLLFEHSRGADVLFSPNENWIVINNYFDSGNTEVRLFQKTKGLKYQEMKKADATQKCWALLDRTVGRSVSKDLDHSYIRAIQWAADSRAVLLVAWGHLSGEPVQVNDWLCVFDIERLRASTDMRIMNRGAVQDTRKP
jgi:hypothetical protein